MKRKEQMYLITMEECAELSQVCSKMIRSGGKEKYLQELRDEVGDVMTMIEILKMSGVVTQQQIEDRMKIKKEKLLKWSILFSKDDED